MALIASDFSADRRTVPFERGPSALGRSLPPPPATSPGAAPMTLRWDTVTTSGAATRRRRMTKTASLSALRAPPDG